MPRLSTYSPTIALEICERIAKGESLRAIINGDGMPVRATVHTWLIKHQEFAEKYETAQSLRADEKFDEALDVAEGIAPGSGDDVARDRLRVDTIKWACGRMHPKKYGDRSQVELTGRDGGPIEHRDVSSLSDADLEAIAAGKVTS